MKATVRFNDGWIYSAPVGRCKPQRLNRVLARVKNGVAFEAALLDMPPRERAWLIACAKARAEYEREQRIKAAAEKALAAPEPTP